jgi:membrane fusion protein, copper/silver efflux system
MPISNDSPAGAAPSREPTVSTIPNLRRQWAKRLGLPVLIGAGSFAALLALMRARSENPPAAASNITALATPAGSGPSTHPAQKQLWTCGMHPQVIQDHPGLCPICHMRLVPMRAAGGGALGHTHLTIDPIVVQNMGVLTAPVTRGPLNVTIRAMAMLQVPEPSQHDVTVRIGGYVVHLYADTPGMHVHKGEVLFDLYSPELQTIEAELMIGRRGRVGSSEPPSSQPGDIVEAVKLRLELLGIAPQDADAIIAADRFPQSVPIRSPADGDVVDKTILDGSAVIAGTRVMRIEDHARLWLDCQVYESDLPLINPGQPVLATIPALPGKTFVGKVEFIYPHLDHMARSATVRATLDNAPGVLRPGMYAEAQIVAQPASNAILVPRQAVIDTGARQIAFVADPAAPGHFELRDLRVGLAGDGDQLQVLEGLAVGDQVVISGQFLLDVESRTIEAVQKLVGGSESATTQPVTRDTELLTPTSPR